MSDLLNVPFVRQGTGYTCGVASLIAVLDYFGKDAREDMLAKELGASPPNGVTPERIVEVAKRHGILAEMCQGLSIEALANIVISGRPVIVVVQAWSDQPHASYGKDWVDGHYIVAVGVEQKRIVFMDPSLAGRHTSLTSIELQDRWHDKVKGHEYDHMGIIFTGTPAILSDPEDQADAEAEWRRDVQTDPNTPVSAKSHQTTDSVHVPKPLGKEKSTTPGRSRPDGDFDATDLSRGIEQEMSEHGLARDVAKRLVKDHLAEDAKYYSKSGVEQKASPEFYEAFHSAAKKMLQPWQHDQIHRAAVPSAGGRAGRRRPEHSAIEEALLKKLSSDHLKDMPDESLLRAWQDLDKWHKLAARKNLDTADYEAAAEKIADELERRGTQTIDAESHLARVVLAKSALVLPTMDDIVSLMAVGDGVDVLAKSNTLGQCWYAVGVPGELDTESHRIVANECVEAAHRFMLNGCPLGVEHGLSVGLNAKSDLPEFLPRERAVCIESGVTFAPTDKIFGQQLPRTLPEKTWYITVHYLDEKLRDRVMNMTHGASWRGPAKRYDRNTGLRITE